MVPFRSGLSSLFHLFYPHICMGCGSDLLSARNILCISCFANLPYTQFALHSNNPTEKIFWGRIPVRSGMSLLYFTKSSLVQNLIHEFKYKGNLDLGRLLGNLMGKSLLESDRFRDISVIIPLPLFAAKEKQRGFNQAEILCRGLTEKLAVPVISHNVVRILNTETQTRKGRLERWENVDKTFKVLDPARLENEHILLVDDVITTGATIEACAAEILKIRNTSVSIASLALASG